jgi:RNA polymerase sigma-70 factor (ECF subfamily)
MTSVITTQGPSQAEAANQSKWTPLVERIRQGDRDAVGELYEQLLPGLRFYFVNRLGRDAASDAAHSVFLRAVEQTAEGDLREPEALPGYMRTMAARYVCAQIEQRQREQWQSLTPLMESRLSDGRKGPESEYGQQERLTLALKVLRGMSEREREILTRFYLYEQTQEQICREMGLTETQFRLLKSRAKARFGQKGQQQLRRRPLRAVIR